MVKVIHYLFGFNNIEKPLLMNQKAVIKDIKIAFATVVFAYLVSLYFNLAERFSQWLEPYEHLQLDEIPLALFVLAVMSAWFSYRRMGELAAEITRRTKAEHDLEKLLEENQSLARYAMQAQEDERRHIAREIHDDMAQYLTAVRMDALTVQKSAPNELVEYATLRIANNTEHIQKAARALIHRLRPAALDALGLIGAVEQLTEEWEPHHPDTQCALSIDESCQSLDERINIVAYRIVQEAMTNIARYAKAQSVNINIGVSTITRQATLCIEVRDNGIGFDAGVLGKGVGIIGMRERVKSVGGTFNLLTSENSGVLITVKIPVTD
jgi:signal transduction histidine kinase